MTPKEKLKKAIEEMEIENKQAFLDDLENIEILDIEYKELSSTVLFGFIWQDTKMGMSWDAIFNELYKEL